MKREKNEFLNTCGSKAKSQAQRGKGRNSPRVKKCIFVCNFCNFFDFGSLGTSCYNYLLYRLFTILFQFFTNGVSDFTAAYNYNFHISSKRWLLYISIFFFGKYCKYFKWFFTGKLWSGYSYWRGINNSCYL